MVAHPICCFLCTTDGPFPTTDAWCVVELPLSCVCSSIHLIMLSSSYSNGRADEGTEYGLSIGYLHTMNQYHTQVAHQEARHQHTARSTQQ